jgi:hypothetical protein
MPLTVTPVASALAWWRWATSRCTGWRAYVLLGGLAATTLNVLLFYLWLAYSLAIGSAPYVWQLKEQLSGPAIGAVCVAFVGALLGSGSGRWPLALSAVTGFLLWISFGFL